MKSNYSDPKIDPIDWFSKSYEEKRERIIEFINSPSSDFEYVCGTEVYQYYSNLGSIDKNIDKIRNEIITVYLKHVANDPGITEKLNKIRYARIMLFADEIDYGLA